MSKKKENDMICNGGIAPQVADVLDYYNAYVNAAANVWYAWASASGMRYWTDQYWAAVNRASQGPK